MIRILDVGGMLRRPGDLQVLWLPFDTCVSCVLGLRTAAGSFFSFFLAGVWTRISLFCRWPFDCCCCCCCRGQERDVPRLNWRHPDGRGHFHASHSAGATFILTFLFFFISSSSFVRNERFILSRFVVAGDLHISRPWRHSTCERIVVTLCNTRTTLVNVLEDRIHLKFLLRWIYLWVDCTMKGLAVAIMTRLIGDGYGPAR